MEQSSIKQLLQDLKSPEESTRQRATEQLWQVWFAQKGDLGLEILRRAQTALDLGDLYRANRLLTETIDSLPDFAEAWNRRAVLYYLQEKYQLAKRDCQQVVKLNPNHFGAWHGLGLCEAALGNYLEAIAAFRKALEIQPYALVNQKLILECTTRLSQ